MKGAIAIILVLLCICRTASPQSANDGHIEGDTYINSYFHFSFMWPKIVKPRDPRTLILPGTSGPKEFLMFSAQEDNRPFGIVMLAGKTAPNGIRYGNDFLGRVIRGWSPTSTGRVLNRETITGTNGLKFEILDYKYGDEWNSAITTQVGGYLIAVRCNASNASDLAQMRSSVLASRSTATQK